MARQSANILQQTMTVGPGTMIYSAPKRILKRIPKRILNIKPSRYVCNLNIGVIFLNCLIVIAIKFIHNKIENQSVKGSGQKISSNTLIIVEPLSLVNWSCVLRNISL